MLMDFCELGHFSDYATYEHISDIMHNSLLFDDDLAIAYIRLDVDASKKYLYVHQYNVYFQKPVQNLLNDGCDKLKIARPLCN